MTAGQSEEKGRPTMNDTLRALDAADFIGLVTGHLERQGIDIAAETRAVEYRRREEERQVRDQAQYVQSLASRKRRAYEAWDLEQHLWRTGLGRASLDSVSRRWSEYEQLRKELDAACYGDHAIVADVQRSVW